MAKEISFVDQVGLETRVDNHDRTTSEKLQDEARLLLGSGKFVFDGVKAGLKDMYENPSHILGTGTAAFALGLISRHPYGRMATIGLSVVGTGMLFGKPMIDVWRDRSQLPNAQHQLGTNIGTALAYAPIGIAGYEAGSRISMSTLLRWKDNASIFAYGKLDDQLGPNIIAKGWDMADRGEGERAIRLLAGANKYLDKEYGVGRPQIYTENFYYGAHHAAANGHMNLAQELIKLDRNYVAAIENAGGRYIARNYEQIRPGHMFGIPIDELARVAKSY